MVLRTVFLQAIKLTVSGKRYKDKYMTNLASGSIGN